ncbi:MAG: MobC family plasmid mobilization relaxosome protein [Lentimicrobiaceae bacterium]|nr:MobC family plasmid mobilization relaxosome protein [Lentimicrobiaceae bacterium]
MKTHNKGGRPKMDITDKKSKLLPPIRVTKIQLATIQAKADSASKSITDFVRDSALKGRVKAAISPEQMDEIRKLSNVGNNINQLTKLVHRYGYSEEIQRQLAQVLNQILTTK